MERNKLFFSRDFYTYSLLCCSLLSLASLFISVVVSLAINEYGVMFAFLLGFWIPPVAVLIAKAINKLIFSVAKSGGTKHFVIILAIMLFVLKYLFVASALIVGLSVNAQGIIFEPIALVINALIYPTTTLIVQWCMVSKQKKEKEQY